MPDPDRKPLDAARRDTVSVVALCACAAAVAVSWVGGGTWPTAAAVCGLSVTALGVSYLVLR